MHFQVVQKANEIVILYQNVVPQWNPKHYVESTKLKLSTAVSTIFVAYHNQNLEPQSLSLFCTRY
eukprot:UN02575